MKGGPILEDMKNELTTENSKRRKVEEDLSKVNITGSNAGWHKNCKSCRKLD